MEEKFLIAMHEDDRRDEDADDDEDDLYRHLLADEIMQVKTKIELSCSE